MENCQTLTYIEQTFGQHAIIQTRRWKSSLQMYTSQHTSSILAQQLYQWFLYESESVGNPYKFNTNYSLI